MTLLRGDKIDQLHHFFERSVDTYPDHIALICDGLFISYRELECRANQLAHYLSHRNIKKGSVVGLLIERSVESYLAILAVLKLGAAYVPIETEFPDERINAIFSDISFQAVLVGAQHALRKTPAWPEAVILDDIRHELSLCPTSRPKIEGDGSALCYVIYTSGSTGKPKGVEITHGSICHYVTVARDLYEMTPNDRVYQGFSLAFDASLEELWMAFGSGAALIACTSKEVRSGAGLISFLNQHQVNVFSTVPTLLSCLDGELPLLRLLIMGGEPCLPSLVKRWSRPGLRMLNTYGPTEACVVATCAECSPDKEVTIGVPLIGYEVLIVDEHLREIDEGEIGELCIAGPTLARGYANKSDITDEKFVRNPANKSQRLYRTGDLVQKNEQGELRFLGRVDEQVKLRGFRIELNEIEAVMMDYPGITQAVVSLQHLDQPTLVAYLLMDKHVEYLPTAFKEYLKIKLPDYMIPSIIECIEAFPLLASGKVDRKKLFEKINSR